MIKNIVFDMGNVLLDYNPQICLDEFCNSEDEKDIIHKELFQGPEWVMGDMGQIRDNERYDLVKQRVPERYWSELKQCCDKWDICMVPVIGAKDFCNYAREQGYSVYVLSNASDKFYNYFENFLPLDYFDGIVVSADVHIIKPDSRIYELFLSQYNLKADECLFIDDRLENVKGALAVGMQAYEFENDFETIKKAYHI
jgi:putative hydrolase of the HAD superfamily